MSGSEWLAHFCARPSQKNHCFPTSHLCYSRRKAWYLLGNIVSRKNLGVRKAKDMSDGESKSVPPYSSPSHFSVSDLLWMVANPDVQMVIKHPRKILPIDLDCQNLLINNYQAHNNSKCPTNINHKSNLYIEILLGAFNNNWLPSSHPHLFLPRYPAVLTDPTERTSVKSSLRLRFPSTLQSFVLSFRIPLSVLHQKSSLNANKNQYFRFYC